MSDSDTYECPSCGETFDADSHENPLQAYAGHFNRTDHPDPVSAEAEGTARITNAYQQLVDRVPLFGQLSNIDSESDTEYNGPFSYGVEFHAFFFGVVLGIWWAHDPVAAQNAIAAVISAVFLGERAANRSKRIPNYIVRQAREEMHYFGAGIVAGALLLNHMHGFGSFDVVPDWLGLGV